MTQPAIFRNFLLEVLAQNNAELAEPAERLLFPGAVPVTSNPWPRDTPGITVLEKGTGSGGYPSGAARRGTSKPVASGEIRMTGSLVPQFQPDRPLHRQEVDARRQ
jgi:hypothetical protein